MFHAWFRPVAIALVAVAPLAGCARSTSIGAVPASAPQTTLLVRLGADTLGMEQYTRTATHMEGVIVNRRPSTTVARYRVDIGGGNTPTLAEYSVRRGDGAMLASFPMQSLTMRLGRDSVRLTGHRTSGDTLRTVALSGELMPTAAGGYGMLELALDKLRASGRDSGFFKLVPMQFGVRTSTPLPLKLLSSDAAVYDYFGSPVHVRHDGRANILSVDGAASAFKMRVDRVASVDVEALARTWAAQDQTAGPSGPPSTRDTVRARVGSANIWIDYGRPSLRGRDVWANGVLGDTLWRTGANAATQFRTDADVLIGGTLVPAGIYSLFTSTTGGYRLAINKQSGQWGTVYDVKQDLARVPLRESTNLSSVERFTIAVDAPGVLHFQWGTKQLSVPITSR